jgi:hypothetical protein
VHASQGRDGHPRNRAGVRTMFAIYAVLIAAGIIFFSAVGLAHL